MYLAINICAVVTGGIAVGLVYLEPEAAVALAFMSGVAVTWSSRFEVKVISEDRGLDGTRANDIEDFRQQSKV
jgi:hypothetical protein|tara:strand:+ start:366 stop:584 length:219 start_codon:yes stop_codon:yes gene_type:complete